MNNLELSDLHKSFGTNSVLAGLDLDVPAGSLTAILGPSGSGKTTLLRLIAGFERPDRGTIRIGESILDAEGVHLHPERRRIGYVPQEGGLFPHLNVEANVTFGLSRAARRQGAADLLELVGLSDLARRYPHQISGGQQQRVALARALAIKPTLVLLDEPFASLDANLRVSVREEVASILRESATTTLLVTHDQDEALSLADLIAVLREGKIAQCSTPLDLYARPLDEELARFIGEANLIDGVLHDAFVETALGKLPAHCHNASPHTPCPVTVLLRPEQIHLHPPDGTNSLAGKILKSGYHGHDAVLHVQVGQPGVRRPLIVRTSGDKGLPPGSRVSLSAEGPVLVWPVRSALIEDRVIGRA